MDVKHLIDALRGGNGDGLPNTRRYPDGTVVKFNRPTEIRKGVFVNPRGAPDNFNGPGVSDKLRGMLPTGLRKQQLHNQEVKAGLTSKDEEY